MGKRNTCYGLGCRHSSHGSTQAKQSRSSKRRLATLERQWSAKTKYSNTIIVSISHKKNSSKITKQYRNDWLVLSERIFMGWIIRLEKRHHASIAEISWTMHSSGPLSEGREDRGEDVSFYADNSDAVASNQLNLNWAIPSRTFLVINFSVLLTNK